MASTQFKRKETLVQGVRRLAVRRIDKLTKMLGEWPLDDDTRAAAQRQAYCFDALLQLVRGPLGPEVMRRESRWLRRLHKSLNTPPTLSEHGQGTGQDPPQPGISPKKALSNPARLRRLADLAEARMRAQYWHLPAGEFDLLAPGLRRSYGRARKLADDPQKLNELADALRMLTHHLHLIQKAWPDVLDAMRQEAAAAEKHARRLDELQSLPSADKHPSDDMPDHAVQKTNLQSDLGQSTGRLLTESAPAFAKRVEAYWNAWRA